MSPSSNYKRSPGKRKQYSPRTHRGMVDTVADQMWEDLLEDKFEETRPFYDSLDLPPMVLRDAKLQIHKRIQNAKRTPPKYRPRTTKLVTVPITTPNIDFVRRKNLQMVNDLSKEIAIELINKKHCNLDKYYARGVPYWVVLKAEQKAYDLEKQMLENWPKTLIGEKYGDRSLGFLRFKRIRRGATHLNNPVQNYGPYERKRIWIGRPYDAKVQLDGWAESKAVLHPWYSPGKYKTIMEMRRKSVKPDFADQDDVAYLMMEDEITGNFDPDKPQGEQVEPMYHTVPKKMYDEALEMFKVFTGINKFDDLPEKTVDNPLRSPTFDPRITENVTYARREHLRLQQDFMNRGRLQDRFNRLMRRDDEKPVEKNNTDTGDDEDGDDDL